MPNEENINSKALLSSVAMTARRAKTYDPEVRVIDIEEVRQIIQELLEDATQGES